MTVFMSGIAIESVKSIAAGCGLTVLGVTDLAPLQPDAERLAAWQKSGFAGEMQYMQREPALLSDPTKLCTDAQSVVSFALRYDQSAVVDRPTGFGRVARYAWGRDYHRVIKKCLTVFVRECGATLGFKPSHRIFVDAVPLLERALAERAGLGFIGKNSMLIRPGYGSMFFIAQLLWELEVVGSGEERSGSCGDCIRCVSACPTDAIVSERVVDARRCISYLTIEKRTPFSAWERSAIGEWVFGCDICQDVCPFNYAGLKREVRADLESLNAEHGVGPVLNLEDVLSLRTHEQFTAQFGGTALMRAGREGLLRNAAIVAANTSAVQLIPALIDTVEDDSSELVRQHALWACSQLSSGRQVSNILDRALRDPCPQVVKEAKSIVDGSFEVT